MSASNRIKNQHLLWRAAFGPTAENTAALDTLSTKKLWQLLSSSSSKAPVKIEVAQNMADIFLGEINNNAMKKKEVDKEQRKFIRERSREDIKNLNIRWLEEMISSEAQLREKMSFFWHGHFASRVFNSYFQQELLHIIRENALGNFTQLLLAVSKSASMLSFLNNQQNRKQHPNENFAREVMELFTLGRGNYTETDVKEAARAFTGWGFNINGEFVFRKAQHDNGSKTVLGKSGNFNGEDIIYLLTEQKQTARFITKKIYRYFVNENADEEKTEWLSNRFFLSNYDIKKLLEDIYTSNWFYEKKNIGNKIKSPVELWVGIRRLLPMQMEDMQTQLLFQRILGQVLFYPPNVAGWPGGKSWIDSSSLMLRMRIPQMITINEALDIQPKTDDDVMMGIMQAGMKKMKEAVKGSTAVIEWVTVNKLFEKIPREKLFRQIADTVLQSANHINENLLDNHLNKENRENYIKSVVVHLMSTPEYQLC